MRLCLIDGVDRDLQITVGGQQDAHRLRTDLERLGEEVDAVYVRHLVVGQEKIGESPRALQFLERCCAILRGRNGISAASEQVFQNEAYVVLVINRRYMVCLQSSLIVTFKEIREWPR